MRFPATATTWSRSRTRVFRGREDFIYRMALGELPFVTGIFPLGGKAGEATRVAMQGWNLPYEQPDDGCHEQECRHRTA